MRMKSNRANVLLHQREVMPIGHMCHEECEWKGIAGSLGGG